MNPSFSIMVKTGSPDANGLTHCVEHLCLRGSKAYPCGHVIYLVRNTCAFKFVNAGTYGDRTLFVGVMCDAESYIRSFEMMLDGVC